MDFIGDVGLIEVLSAVHCGFRLPLAVQYLIELKLITHTVSIFIIKYIACQLKLKYLKGKGRLVFKCLDDLGPMLQRVLNVKSKAALPPGFLVCCIYTNFEFSRLHLHFLFGIELLVLIIEPLGSGHNLVLQFRIIQVIKE